MFVSMFVFVLVDGRENEDSCVRIWDCERGCGCDWGSVSGKGRI